MKILGRDITSIRSLLGSRVETRSIEDPNTSIAAYLQATLDSGSDPSRANVRTLSIIYAAIRIISEDFGSLPFGLYQQKGGYYETLDHDLNYIVGVAPNTSQNAFQWKETSTANIYTHGNAYSYIVLSPDRRSISEIKYLDPDDTNPVYVPKIDKIGYLRRGAETLHSEDVLHIPFLNFNIKSAKAPGPIDILKETARVALNSRDYANTIQKNGTFSNLGMEHPGNLSDKALKNLQASLKNQYGGVNNAGKIIVAEEGMKFKPLNMSPADIEMISTQKWLVEELLRPFRVPAHMAQSLDRSTMNNIEHQSLEYVMYCLRPLAKRWESEYDRKLLTRDEYNKGYRWKVNLRALLRGDIKTQTDYIQKMVVSGVMSRNEGRDFLGLPAKEGLDEMLTPVNLFNPDTSDDANPDSKGQRSIPFPIMNGHDHPNN